MRSKLCLGSSSKSCLHDEHRRENRLGRRWCARGTQSAGFGLSHRYAAKDAVRNPLSCMGEDQVCQHEDESGREGKNKTCATRTCSAEASATKGQEKAACTHCQSRP